VSIAITIVILSITCQLLPLVLQGCNNVSIAIKGHLPCCRCLGSSPIEGSLPSYNPISIEQNRIVFNCVSKEERKKTSNKFFSHQHTSFLLHNPNIHKEDLTLQPLLTTLLYMFLKNSSKIALYNEIKKTPSKGFHPPPQITSFLAQILIFS